MTTNGQHRETHAPLLEVEAVMLTHCKSTQLTDLDAARTNINEFHFSDSMSNSSVNTTPFFKCLFKFFTYF